MVRRTYSKEIHEHQVSQKVQETSNDHTTKEGKLGRSAEDSLKNMPITTLSWTMNRTLLFRIQLCQGTTDFIPVRRRI